MPISGLSFSKSGSSSSSVTEPWQALQPYLKTLFSEAQNTYDNHTPSYFPSSTVAPQTPAQQNLLQQLTTQNPQALQSGLGAAQNIASRPNFNTQQLFNSAANTAQGSLQSGVQGLQNTQGQALGLPNSFNALQQQLNAAQLNPAAQDQLQATARGDYLNNNPYIDSVYDSGARRLQEAYQNTIAPGIDSSFAAAGRSLSGLHANARAQAGGQYSDSLSDLASNIYGSNYANERSQQLQAAGTLGNLDLARQQLGLSSGLGAINSLYNPSQQRALSASSTLGSLGQGLTGQANALANNQTSNNLSGAGLLPSLQGAQTSLLQNSLGAQQNIQQQNQRELNDQISRHNFNQQVPYDKINQLLAVLTGQNWQQSVSESGSSSTSAGIGFGL